MPLSSFILSAWHTFIGRVAVAVYFNHVSLLHPERLQAGGPVLYIALHRNGAVDGFVYHRFVPRGVFMISAQLRRSPIGRMFFTGIEVVRDKDAEGAGRPGNRAALDLCLERLQAGGELIVLPEGTSDLGPRHLPFKRGAARIAAACLARGMELRVVPLGIHYERAWAFRSNVEVVVGPPVDLRVPAGSDEERANTLHGRFTSALEAVGVNVASAAELERVERVAYAATLGTGHSYFAALKAFERGVPGAIAQAFDRLDARCRARGLLRHQGVPLMPMANPALYLLAVVPLGLVVLGALALNLPPLLLAAAAARKFADGRNVVALWRILIGIPALGLWILALACMSFVLPAPQWLALYAGVSACGLAFFYRTKKLVISLYNLFRSPAIRGELMSLHELVRTAVSHA
jgi:1-acyl-sn-glycerol-3-phosphate acyltransferase